MKGKYKNKKLRQNYRPVIQNYRNHPDIFAEDMCGIYGIKLYWYQKMFLKYFCKNKN